jgi:hypothetical protein
LDCHHHALIVSQAYEESNCPTRPTPQTRKSGPAVCLGWSGLRESKWPGESCSGGEGSRIPKRGDVLASSYEADCPASQQGDARCEGCQSGS